MPSEKEVENIKKKMTAKKDDSDKNTVLLSSGSTLLNLATSGKPNGCFRQGSFNYLVGDSSSGKTWLSLTCFAEACLNKAFDNYRLIQDDVEGGSLMDYEKYFGKKAAERIECDHHSESLESFYDRLDTLNNEGKPYIYVLDSMDALVSEEEEEKFAEQKKAREKGKEISGTYGMSKAKKNSSMMRLAVNGLRETGSILIVISQTRANIGYGSQFNPKTRAGGNALTFYASLELWSSIREKIKKTVKGKPRQLGILTKVKVEKNRMTGKLRSIEVPIYYSTGIADLDSMIDFLIEEKHWTGSESKVDAPELEYSGSKEKLISKIEAEDLEVEFRSLVTKIWNEIEEATAIQRKNKYE